MVIEEGNMKKSTKWVVLSLFILCASIVPVNDFDAQENAENSVNLHDNVQTSTSDEYSVSFETTTEESHEDVNNEITEASTSSEETKQVLAENAELSDEIGAISPLVGEGTLESPYTAATADELIRVMSEINNDSGSGTYYVALTADIVYTDADVFEFYKNVEIDGQNHHMLYTNASNSTASNTGYRVKISGLRIKLKNMNFGSATLTDENGVIYGNQSYYGILGAGSLSVLSFDAVFENVNYYGKTGAQPLLAWHTESTFTFEGKNEFVSEAGANSEEFMEGNNITFAKDSTTIINHQTSTNLALFYGSASGGSGDRKIRVTLEENANVQLTSSKDYFSYDGTGLIFTIGQNAKFLYEQTGNKPMNFTNGQAAEINFGANSQTSMISQGRFNSNGNVVMNADEPDFVRFQNTSNTNGLFARNMTFNRIDGVAGEIGGYQFSYLATDQSLQKKEVVGAGTATLNDSYFTNTALKQAIYQKKINITDWKAQPSVAVGQSQLDTTINAYEPASRIGKATTFKLSTKQLWSETDLTTEEAQQQVELADENTDGMIAVEETAGMTWTKEKLPAGTYFVYTKIAGAVNDDPELQAYLTESLWVEQQVEVVKSPLSVEVPLEMIFESKTEGAFDTASSTKPIISSSNYPIDFTIGTLQDLTADSSVVLVNQFSGGNHNELILNLVATDGTTMGPLVVGQNNVDRLEIAPFLTEPIELYLAGEFSGNILQKYYPSYAFTYQLSAKE